MEIAHTKIGSTRVYWVEGDFPQQWRIVSYNLESGAFSTIRESSSHKTSTMTPRLDNEHDTLLWLEGYKVRSGELQHDIYSFSPAQGITRITSVTYVANPYCIIRIRNHFISFTDIMDGKWVVRIINITNNQEKIILFNEEPHHPVSDGITLAWLERNNLYFFENIKKTHYKQFLDHNIFLFDLYQGNIFYTKSSAENHVFKYCSHHGVTRCLTENAHKEHLFGKDILHHSKK